MTSAVACRVQCRARLRLCSKKGSRSHPSSSTPRVCAMMRSSPSSSATHACPICSADLDSEIQACVMGARRMTGLFERFGTETVEACFQAILDKCRDIYRNELLPKIADGEYFWEDYVEHDGVTDPKLHKLALKMTKNGGRITLEFTGTDPNTTGPINWPCL